jgi:hypothetical protein
MPNVETEKHIINSEKITNAPLKEDFFETELYFVITRPGHLLSCRNPVKNMMHKIMQIILSIYKFLSLIMLMCKRNGQETG